MNQFNSRAVNIRITFEDESGAVNCQTHKIFILMPFNSLELETRNDYCELRNILLLFSAENSWAFRVSRHKTLCKVFPQFPSIYSSFAPSPPHKQQKVYAKINNLVYQQIVFFHFNNPVEQEKPKRNEMRKSRSKKIIIIHSRFCSS